MSLYDLHCLALLSNATLMLYHSFRVCSLDEHVIVIGPYTILTVDEGYASEL